MVIKPLVLFFCGIDEEGCNDGMKINMATQINSPEKVLFPGIIRWADVGRQTNLTSIVIKLQYVTMCTVICPLTSGPAAIRNDGNIGL